MSSESKELKSIKQKKVKKVEKIQGKPALIGSKVTVKEITFQDLKTLAAKHLISENQEEKLKTDLKKRILP